MSTGAQRAIEYQWEPQPAAQALVSELTDAILHRCPAAKSLAERMLAESATRFADWIDSLHVPADDRLRERLRETGFTPVELPGVPEAFRHEGAIFPTIVLSTGAPSRIMLKVDSVSDFLAAQHITDEETIKGSPVSLLRMARAFRGNDAELWAIERHGVEGFAIHHIEDSIGLRRLHHLEVLRRRRRDFETEREAFDHLHALVDAAVADLGQDTACEVFFAAERDYWQRRNTAARVQKARQDRLGLGWANHDHHTYRSSREWFKDLIATFERLGFFCRESFYAGSQAGWGAQVLEQPRTGIVIFADVDMSPEELMGDFAHEGLPQRDDLGTVGLWCALHGESALRAGMHHLECQFDWNALKDQLERDAGIRTMDPFTTFPFLRQAFTEGERWPVDPARIDRLVTSGQITPEQAEGFRAQGAIGSHLENLERNDGYKGFNQEGVSDIIARTDPRRHAIGSS